MYDSTVSGATRIAKVVIERWSRCFTVFDVQEWGLPKYDRLRASNI
jgi:hypothetical protein